MGTAGNEPPPTPGSSGADANDARKVGEQRERRSRELFTGVLSTVIVAILIGSAAPWWWHELFPAAARTAATPADCPVDAIKDQILGSRGDPSAFINADAQSMREMLRDGNIACVEAVAGVLLRVDANNGSGLYFAGEVWRVRAKREPANALAWRERMREHFFRYIEAEKVLPADERDGRGEACYRRAKGFCAERTAWVNHLMAIDYLQQAADAADATARQGYLRRASEFVSKDVAFGGFDQVIPTADLQLRIQAQLRADAGR